MVSATTATSAISAVAVGPLADGDAGRFAVLSAALAILSGVVLVGAGLLRLGGIMDFVSKPVMTGFLFGLGLTVAVGQLPKLFGVEGGSGTFFELLEALIEVLDDTSGSTLAVGIGSVIVLIATKRLAPRVPGTLLVLVLAIVASALFDFASHGVDVVGDLPSPCLDCPGPTSPAPKPSAFSVQRSASWWSAPRPSAFLAASRARTAMR